RRAHSACAVRDCAQPPVGPGRGRRAVAQQGHREAHVAVRAPAQAAGRGARGDAAAGGRERRPRAHARPGRGRARRNDEQPPLRRHAGCAGAPGAAAGAVGVGGAHHAHGAAGDADGHGSVRVERPRARDGRGVLGVGRGRRQHRDLPRRERRGAAALAPHARSVRVHDPRARAAAAAALRARRVRPLAGRRDRGGRVAAARAAARALRRAHGPAGPAAAAGVGAAGRGARGHLPRAVRALQPGADADLPHAVPPAAQRAGGRAHRVRQDRGGRAGAVVGVPRAPAPEGRLHCAAQGAGQGARGRLARAAVRAAGPVAGRDDRRRQPRPRRRAARRHHRHDAREVGRRQPRVAGARLRDARGA
ncbi:hypothetical protein GGF37_007352, partial [Kickxella alabastrina]